MTCGFVHFSPRTEYDRIFGFAWIRLHDPFTTQYKRWASIDAVVEPAPVVEHHPPALPLPHNLHMSSRQGRRAH